MKKYTILFFVLVLFCQCKTSSGSIAVQYEYLQVERLGGGQLDFRIYPGNSPSNLTIYVSSSNFQPIEKQFQLQLDDINVDAFDDFHKAIVGQMELKGAKAAGGKLKGTWLNLTFKGGNRSTEITNPELIERFKIFEELVRQQLK